MSNIAQWIVESSICLIVFYAFYQLILSKETFFQWNRWYLILSPALSITIPLIHMDWSAPTPSTYQPLLQIVAPIVEESHWIEQQVWQAPAPTLQWGTVAWCIYLIGVIIMAIQLLYGLWKLFHLIGQSQIEQHGPYKMVIDSPFPASSFFSYVFWNKKALSKQAQLVWEHELVHVRQYHSLDVLLMELWVIIKMV